MGSVGRGLDTGGVISYPDGKGLVVIVRCGKDPWFRVDEERLWSTFDRLKEAHGDGSTVEVISYGDVTREKMRQITGEVSQKLGGASYSYLAFFLLGHGGNCNQSGKDYVRTSDGRIVYLDSEIFGQFDNERCQGLMGKPRFFLCQMCRGPAVNGPVSYAARPGW